ncbi:hypothetical protein [Pseudofulvibacter geojedonensis]|uniref:C1q domain-containing protein n=1 Tax=Pseudofulvibacter geojedonensis TaxID=1123758 RepID=A0ABW3I306_9FLAO
MKTLLTLLLISPLYLYSQVGIGTTSPTATLDINGDLEIVNTPSSNVSGINPNNEIILVKDQSSNQVQSLSIKDLINSYFKTFIKCSKSSDEQVNLVTASGTSQVIDFNTVEIDSNNEYSTASKSFTPKQDGWYEIHVQITIEPTNPISASISNDFRLNIVKNSSVIAFDTGVLATLTALGTNVYTQPTRKVGTLVYLTTSDTIQFQAQNNNSLVPAAIDINLLGNSSQTYFSIRQVR